MLLGQFLDWHQLRRIFDYALSNASSVGLDPQAVSEFRRTLDLPWRRLVANSTDFVKLDFLDSRIDFLFCLLALKYLLQHLLVNEFAADAWFGFRRARVHFVVQSLERIVEYLWSHQEMLFLRFALLYE